MRDTPIRIALFLTMLVVAGSCSSDATAPTMESIAGDYVATSFTGAGSDILAAGGGLSLALSADGSVAGSLSIPAEAGGPLEVDMAGTYTLDGSRVTFHQDGDSFVRDADWTWTDGVLNGSWSGSGGTISVRMVRQ